MRVTAKPRRRWLICLVLALLVVLAGVFLVRHWQKTSAGEYRSFASPGGEYRIVVYSIPSLLPMMPGHGGDASGFVRLYNRAGGILQEKPVDMVQSIQTVEWETDRVRIKLFADWPLPHK